MQNVHFLKFFILRENDFINDNLKWIKYVTNKNDVNPILRFETFI